MALTYLKVFTSSCSANCTAPLYCTFVATNSTINVCFIHLLLRTNLKLFYCIDKYNVFRVTEIHCSQFDLPGMKYPRILKSIAHSLMFWDPSPTVCPENAISSSIFKAIKYILLLFCYFEFASILLCTYINVYLYALSSKNTNIMGFLT